MILLSLHIFSVKGIIMECCIDDICGIWVGGWFLRWNEKVVWLANIFKKCIFFASLWMLNMHGKSKFNLNFTNISLDLSEISEFHWN